MNKIERAISELKIKLKNKKRDLIFLQSEIKSISELLFSLEEIKNDDTIPNDINKE